MQPTLKTISPKKLIGRRLRMSFVNNRTAELWRSFMSRREEIGQVLGSEFYSVQIYAPGFFAGFNPDTEFEKWATVEVSGFSPTPEGLENLELPGGLYAVFVYRGAACTAAETFQYIFGSWLPASNYELDNRPHFEVLGEKYKNDSPDSEEEIWIPVRGKNV